MSFMKMTRRGLLRASMAALGAFGLKDRRVKLIAEIVHEADLHDGKFTRDESTGVDLALRALAESTGDDHDLLERGMAIFDGLYAVLKGKV